MVTKRPEPARRGGDDDRTEAAKRALERASERRPTRKDDPTDDTGMAGSVIEPIDPGEAG